MTELPSYRQYLLRSGDSELVCWLKDHPAKPIKEGTWITLKEIPDRQWHVIEKYNQVLNKHPSQRWQVGGLE